MITLSKESTSILSQESLLILTYILWWRHFLFSFYSNEHGIGTANSFTELQCEFQSFRVITSYAGTRTRSAGVSILLTVVLPSGRLVNRYFTMYVILLKFVITELLAYGLGLHLVTLQCKYIIPLFTYVYMCSLSSIVFCIICYFIILCVV